MIGACRLGDLVAGRLWTPPPSARGTGVRGLGVLGFRVWARAPTRRFGASSGPAQTVVPWVSRPMNIARVVHPQLPSPAFAVAPAACCS